MTSLPAAENRNRAKPSGNPLDKVKTPDMKIYLVQLTELSLLPALWRVLIGDRQVLVGTRPALPGIRSLIDKAARLMLDRGWMRRPEDLDDGFALRLANPGADFTTDVFRTLEPWVNAVMEFDRADRTFGIFAGAYKHAVCNEVALDLNLVPAVRHLLETRSEDSVALRGFSPLAAAMPQAYGGPADLSQRVRRSAPLHWLINGALAMAMLFYGLVWIMVRLRPWAKSPTTYDVASDFLIRGHHLRILERIRNRPLSVLVVFRSAAMRRDHAATLGGLDHCDVGSGVFPPAAALRSGTTLIVDTLRVFRELGGDPPRLFKALLSTVFHRVKIAGLLQRFRFAHHLGRDDYNPEHLMRTALFRRIGIRTYGLVHGLPVPETIQAVWRYVDYDNYFVFGRHLYDRYYKATWSPQMTVHAVGSFGMTADRWARLNGARTRDVLFFITMSRDLDDFFAQAVRLAQLLPDRRIWLRPKRTRLREGRFDRTFERLADAPDNLQVLDGETYDVLLEHAYAVTSPSTTVAAEAVQFGAYVFVLDNPALASSYYREFKGLCEPTADTIAQRIVDIERGDRAYDRSVLAGLIACDVDDPVSRMLSVMDPDRLPRDGDLPN